MAKISNRWWLNHQRSLPLAENPSKRLSEFDYLYLCY